MKFLLYPLALLYGLAVFMRNMLFNAGILSSRTFPVKIISVGNLTTGGTGKSPHIEYLVHIVTNLKEIKITEEDIAILSRGYGRKTKGFIVAGSSKGAEEVGDEPAQIKNKLPGITIAVDEKRVHGIRELMKLNPNLKLILLDDAFQHRYVKPGLSILLTRYNAPFYNDHLLPVGNLREPKSAYLRADAILVTSVPERFTDIEKKLFIKKIVPSHHQKVFFSSIFYDSLKPVFPVCTVKMSIAQEGTAILLTGIANPANLLQYLEGKLKSIKHIRYADHHPFSLVEMMRLADEYKAINSSEKCILTTGKDAARLQNPAFEEIFIGIPFYYIPIRVKVQEESVFEEQIVNFVRR